VAQGKLPRPIDTGETLVALEGSGGDHGKLGDEDARATELERIRESARRNLHRG
jgi:hypothetical protein